jgi:type VI secretion system secreted protein VgrG
VFEEQSAKQILQTILTSGGVTNAQFRLTGEPKLRAYTVQYNETALDFAIRLMEEEGYFYFFEHSATDHVMVIANANTTFQPLQEPNVTLGAASTERNQLTSWGPFQATAWGKVQLKDYDPTVPSSNLDDSEPTLKPSTGSTMRDVFRWPAHAFAADDVKQRARRLMEAAEAQSGLIEGTGTAEGFVPGKTCVLDRDPQTGAQDQTYVIQSVFHQATSQGFLTGAPVTSYANRFTVFAASQTWRELPLMQRPHMAGIYSALVIGPEGEEIFADQFGRVRVLFRWDWRKESTPDRSVWLRVIQPWAGKSWGWQHLPRVGTEVAVAFMDGDVDRPVVVGGIYNGEYMPPFAPVTPSQAEGDVFLAQQLRRFCGLKTASTPRPQNSKSRYHLLRFDDTYDCEQVLLRSQGRLDVTAYSSSFETTYGNKNVKVVKGTPPNGQPVGGNMYTTVDQEYDLHVGTNRYEQVDKDYEITVKGNTRADLEGNLDAVIKGDVSIGLNSLTIEATEKITLKVGSSFIVIDHCAVYINGPSMIYENSGGSAQSAASVTLQNVTDASAAEPGDQWSTRLTECHAAASGGGPPGTHTVSPTPAPACDSVTNGVSCDFLSVSSDGGNGSNDASTDS